MNTLIKGPPSPKQRPHKLLSTLWFDGKVYLELEREEEISNKILYTLLSIDKYLQSSSIIFLYFAPWSLSSRCILSHTHTIENKNGNGFNDAFCFSQGLPIFPKGAKIKSLGGYSIGIAQLRGGPYFHQEEVVAMWKNQVASWEVVVLPRKRAPFSKMAIIQMSSFATV